MTTVLSARPDSAKAATLRPGVDVVDGAGPAVFQNAHKVSILDERTFTGDAILVPIAGQPPARLPVPGTELGLTYSDIRALAVLPLRRPWS